MHDVIICDEEFESASDSVSYACHRLEKFIWYYILIMKKVCSEGLVSGGASDAMKVYLEYAQRLKDVADLIAETHNMVKVMLLEDIDSADKYLY